MPQEMPLCSFDGANWLPKGKFLATDVAAGFGLDIKSLYNRLTRLRENGLWPHEPHYHYRSGRRLRAFYLHEIREMESRWKNVRFLPERLPIPDIETAPPSVDDGYDEELHQGRLKRLETLSAFADYGYIPSEVLEWATNTHRLLLSKVWDSRREACRKRGIPFEGLRLLGWVVSPFQMLQDEVWWEIRRAGELFEEIGLLGRLMTVPAEQPEKDSDSDLSVQSSAFEQRLQRQALHFLELYPMGLSTSDMSRRLCTTLNETMQTLTNLELQGKVHSIPGDDPRRTMWMPVEKAPGA